LIRQGPEGPFFVSGWDAETPPAAVAQRYGGTYGVPVQCTRSPLEGAKVFIDGVVLEKVDASAPRYMTRTAWVNHLLDRAIVQLASEPYVSAAVADA
jgi:hypothetical protein